MVTKKVKVAELIFDWNLWPRHEAEDLDSTNIQRMKQAILAGVKLPPIIVNKKDMRIVDGFHRTKATEKLYGDDATIEAEFREYKNDAEMFLDSARANNQHGLPLSPKDRVHVILKARRFKIPMPAIAEALGLDAEAAMKFLADRTARNRDGEIIPLSGGALALKGKTLTQKQEDYVKHCPGTSAQMYARLLLNALKADAIIFNGKVVEALRELSSLLDKILLEVE